MTLQELVDAALQKVSDTELISGHRRLHEWFASGQNIEAVKKAHARVFLEFVRRGVHHGSPSELDEVATPKIEGDLYNHIINVEPLLGDDINQEDLKKRHASLHDIWLSQRINASGKIHPNEELQNAHDLIADHMDNHPEWDSLDLEWSNEIRTFTLGFGEKFIHLEEVLLGFPNALKLIPDVVTCCDDSIFVSKGITGFLYNTILVKLIRRVGKEFRILDTPPSDFIKKFDLSLIRSNNLNEIQLSQEFIFKDRYVLSNPFIFLVGAIVFKRFSINDADVLIKSGVPDWVFQHVISCLTIEHPLLSKLHFIRDEGLGPISSHIPLYSLVLEGHK